MIHPLTLCTSSCEVLKRNALCSHHDPVVPEEAATDGAEGTGTMEAAASTPAVPRGVRITLAI